MDSGPKIAQKKIPDQNSGGGYIGPLLIEKIKFLLYLLQNRISLLLIRYLFIYC